MKRRYTITATAFLGVLLIRSAAGDTSDALSQFLNRPSGKNLSRLEASNIRLRPDSLTNDRLNDLVSAGNIYAAKFLVENLDQLDGADLEEALKALGSFGDRNLDELLRLSHDGLLSRKNLDWALCSTPDEMVDRTGLEIRFLEARKRKLSELKDPSLSAETTEVSRKLDNEIRLMSTGF